MDRLSDDTHTYISCLIVEQGGVEGVTEDDTVVAGFGEEPEEDDEEFSMGSINVFRSPAYKRERGLAVEDDSEIEDSFKYGEGAVSESSLLPSWSSQILYLSELM